MSHIPLLFFLSQYQVFLIRRSTRRELPFSSCHIGGLAQGGNPVPEEKGECRGGPTNALGCCLCCGILSFPAGFNLE